jgi:hypothetical protein
MNLSSTTIAAGQSALAKANWLEAKNQFETARKESDTPEARDGLGLALWWLNEISASHEHRTLQRVKRKSWNCSLVD